LAWVIGHALRRKRWLVAALTIVVTVVSVLPGSFGHKSALESGIEMAQRDVSTYQEGRAKTSVAYRLDFAKTSWQLVRERPLVGYGTGAFVPAYAEYVKLHDPVQEPTHNPHNDYLFYWIESGLPGLVAVIALYAVSLIGAWRIGGLRGTCLAALVLAWAISGLANSMLLDHPTSFAFVALLAALASGPLPFGERTVLASANQEAAGNEVTKLRSP
jgi:O-antigen ligase